MRTCGLAILLVLAGALHAQFLPDIERFEVEDVRLVLLDASGKRRGVLKGELARKQRDGTVHVEKAELRIEQGEDAFVIKADVFDYTPATSGFDCPDGLDADLPNDGYLNVPKGKGTIDYADGVKFHMTVEGEARMRDGPESDALVDARIMNPVIDASFKAIKVERVVEGKKVQGDAFEIEFITIVGDRGGDCKLRLAELPSVAENDTSGPSVVSVSCFGDVSVTVKKETAELHMLRRARMALEDGSFAVTSNLLDIRGQIVPLEKEKDEEKKEQPKEGARVAATLADIAIDADQNVALQGKGAVQEGKREGGTNFNGRCASLRYREFGRRREIRMEGEPGLNFDQGKDAEGATVQIELRARDYIDVQVPDTGTGRVPAEIATELSGNGSARRLLDSRMEWQIAGRQVRLFSVLDAGATRENVYNHSFDANAGGYTPLLRVAGIGGEGAAPELQRASVFGARSEGSYTGGRLLVRVYGPDVLGVVHSDAPLADMLKIAMRLKSPPEENGRPVRPAPRNGRLTVRATTLLELALATTSSGDLSLTADGAVQLDHEPQPRDDKNLVTLTGDALALELQAGDLVAAHLRSATQAIATLGLDLLICRDLDVDEIGDGLHGTMTGPGRVVARDRASVDYFRRVLDRLPKPANAPQQREPDAAWLDFAGAFRAQTAPLARSLEVEGPDFKLVDGDFEKPRAGRTAIDDLDELTDATVLLLYEVSGLRAYARSVRGSDAPDAPVVNVMRLEGDARINSRLDQFTAAAREAIEISGSEERDAPDAPLTIVLLRDAHLHIEDGELFFGEYVRSGAFAYNGGWMLDAAERLEITFRPIEVAGADVGPVRKLLSLSLDQKRPTAERLHALASATAALRVMTADERPTAPGADQAWEALKESEEAEKTLRQALLYEMMQWPLQHAARAEADRSARRARALLSALIDVAGAGGLRGRFHSRDSRVPTLTLEMREALFTFDGLGQIVDVNAAGPIQVSRESYTITGNSLRREPDGTLTLDGAAITLPADAGVTIEGVKAVSLKQREGGRTMVTRVSGKNLRVSVKLAPLHK